MLQNVKRDDYEYQWKPLISFLQLRPTDLNKQYNTDYRLPGFPSEDRRGGYPYYLPLDWYRHGLKVDDKYPDDTLWLGCANVEGEWPVAFHGTKPDAAAGIVEKGLMPSFTSTDLKIKEAVKQKGPAVNRPGIYVATHCDGGAERYAQEFTVEKSSDLLETFKLVFQCRVKPNSFTIHRSPVKIGKAWRLIDGEAVRPYGILIKTVQKSYH